MELKDIKSILVHWSESALINEELGCNEDDDIEKVVEVKKFDDLIHRASKLVDVGYDKTTLSITMKSGEMLCKQCKFYLTPENDTLLKLIRE